MTLALPAPAPAFGREVGATLAWARDLGPGYLGARWAERWEALARIAEADVAGARMVEPDLDARTILQQAATDPAYRTVATDIGAGADASWGVFAAEGSGGRLEAHRLGGSWRLDGTKPWCSLADRLSHALVTAWVGPDVRRLFAVALRAPGVHPHGGPWVARGLPGVVSAPVDFAGARAVPVGAPGWYLARPGFAWGGVGIAAIWLGAARPLRTALARAAAEDADALAAAALGSADAALWAGEATLAAAAAAADGGASEVDASVVAARTRNVVAGVAEHVLSLAERTLGPAPLATDEAYASRVADLRMYLRQHHGQRDLARLGREVRARWT